ncbi:MMPL family transporter, partial [Myxococcota bacterium]|nr:MMPL family transporter [Myxococcota bacterium]
QPFGLDDLPETTTSQFKPVPSANKQGYLTYIYPKVSLWESKDLLRFVDEVGKFEIGDKTYYSAGMAVLYAELAQIVLNDGIRLTILSIIAIFIIIFFNFGRHFRAALLAMLPLATGMLWMLGLMALTGWRINFMNIVVFPLVFGYGISAGIHLYHRYLEAGSALLSVKRTGSAVAASSITTLVGWASLLVSGHSGLTSMGILASFGIASSLVVSLTILPAVLELFGSKIRHPREPGAKMESA